MSEALERSEISYVCMRAGNGFPAWQQFNQRANFINPSAIRRGAAERYLRNAVHASTREVRERRRVWRRTKTGGFAATISLMPTRPPILYGKRRACDNLSRKTPTENFSNVMFIVTSHRKYMSALACVCLYLVYVYARIRMYMCACTLFVPPQYRPDTRISCTW